MPGASPVKHNVDAFLDHSDDYKLDDVEANLHKIHKEFIQFKERVEFLADIFITGLDATNDSSLCFLCFLCSYGKKRCVLLNHSSCPKLLATCVEGSTKDA